MRHARGPRRNLLDTDLLYLFSYDANLEMRRDELGFVPGGLRVNISAKPNETRAYHVARERSTLSFNTVQGTVAWGVDRALVRTDDIGVLDVRLTIRTDDGATIYSWYEGVFPSGERGYRRLISEDPLLGTEEEPFEGRVYVTPRYETGDPRYQWLMQYQCVGIGRVIIIKSSVRRASFDIYAMD
ncbi:MAG: DUF3237 family protein [Myxococcales bacterium]|nr:DUF3237 family protein [Myxococcales bacterium]MDD9971624.1 DUF3237 family protein [Myxococcales bacterium]